MRLSFHRTIAFIFLCLIAFAVTNFACGEAVWLESPPKTEATRKVVYITFDDGPHTRTTELLQVLAEENVLATFFLVGKSVDLYPEETRAIYEAGHALACHSYSHVRWALMSEEKFLQEMDAFHTALRTALGEPVDVRVFRFPYGSNWAGGEIQRMVNSHGYLWIDWNAMNNDARNDTPSNRASMLKQAMYSSVGKDEIVLLLHEGKSGTIAILPELLAFYRARGYEFDVLTPELDHLIHGVNMGLPDGRMQ